MPEEEPIIVLENHVHRLLKVVKSLKEDNSHLQEQVKQIGRQLARKQNEEGRWTLDRTKVEAKVKRILDELDSFTGSS